MYQAPEGLHAVKPLKGLLAKFTCNYKGNKGEKSPVEKKENYAFVYIVLVILSVIAFVMVIESTAFCGAAMSPDSVCYISTAEHLLAGKGYIQFDGSHYAQWPPLFPTILAVPGLFGIKPFAAARFINGISFGLIVFLSGVLFARRIKSRLLVLLGATAVLLSFTMLQISVYVWSEPIFIVLAVLFVLNISQFLENNRTKYLMLASAFAGLACLQRYVGLTTIITGEILILLFARNISWRAKLKYCVLFGVIAFAPVCLWAVRNIFVASGFGGYQAKFDTNIWDKITKPLVQITPWFVSYRVPFAARLTILAITACLLVAASVLRRYVCGKKYSGDVMLVKTSVIFTLVYSVFTITASIFTNAVANERLFSTTYLFVIFLMLIGIEAVGILLNLVTRKDWAGYLVVVVLCGLWLAIYLLPIVKQRVFYYKEYGDGYSSVSWRRSPLINWLKSHPLQGQVFSNEPDGLFFLDGIEAKYSPRCSADIVKFKKLMASPQKNYLVWYLPNGRKYLYDPKELNAVFRLTLIKQFPDGLIFAME